MRTVVFKNGSKIDLVEGLEYDLDTVVTGHRVLNIYDTRYEPEKKRTFLLDNILSWGDDIV